MSADVELQDYSGQLRMSIAREIAGEALYVARGVAYELSGPTWKALTHETRERYREQGQANIEAVKPQPRGMPPLVIVKAREDSDVI